MKYILFCAIGLFVVSAFLSCDFVNSCKIWFQDNETQLVYHGVVKEKFIDSTDRGQPRVILDDGKKYQLQNSVIFDRINIGDIMFKDSGTMVRFLVQDGDTIAYYQQCGDGNDVK